MDLSVLPIRPGSRGVTAVGRPPALLLGGSANALSAARSLAARGVVVEAYGDGLGSSPVRWSNAIRRFDDPVTDEVQEEWLRWLADAETPAALIPCCDDAVELIANHRDELRSLGHLVPDGVGAVSLAMLDKAATVAIANRAGVPAPLVCTVADVDALTDAGDAIGFPCGIKPLHAHLFTRENNGLKGATASDRRQLHEIGARLLESGHELLVTEIIPGADPVFCSYNTFIDDDGEHLFEITKEKLRQYPIDFGLGTFHRTRWLPEVADLGRRFLAASGLRGFGNVEFRRDARDGTLKIIECNVRLTAANELLTRAGCDVADVVYRRTIGEPVDRIPGFREGLRMWHPARDTRAFLRYRATGQLSWTRWLRDVVPPPALPLFSMADPAPSAATLGRKLRSNLPSRPSTDQGGST